MSESAVQVPSGPSLEQILWRAMDRFAVESPMVVDAESFAAQIAGVFDGDVAAEAFVDRFFNGDLSSAPRPVDIAEAIVKATRQRMEAFEFNLNQLEYVVVEEKDDLLVISDYGQFSLRMDDGLQRAVQAAIIPGATSSHSPVPGPRQESAAPLRLAGAAPRREGSQLQMQSQQPRAMFVRANGEMVAVDVAKLAHALQQAKVQHVVAPKMEDPKLRLSPYNPVKRTLSADREAKVLRQDARTRKALSALPPAPGKLAGSEKQIAVARAAATVLLVMPDGTLAKPAMGSGSRWREMVGEWVAKAASIASDAPALAADGSARYTVEGQRVVAAKGPASVAAPGVLTLGEVGKAALAQGASLASVRSMNAAVRTLQDDEIAAAVASGARLVGARGDAKQGFWIQPEAYFKPSEDERAVATQVKNTQDGSGTVTAPPATASAAPLGTVTGDPWADWALQVGGRLSSKLGGTGAEASAPGMDLGDLIDPGQVQSSPQRQEIAFSARRVLSFRAPDGSIVVQRDSGAVRLAAIGRPDVSLDFGSAPSVPADQDATQVIEVNLDQQQVVGGQPSAGAQSAAGQPSSGQYSTGQSSTGQSSFQPSNSESRQQRQPIGSRTGALPATALEALTMAIQRTASVGGYKLPMVRIESASDALDVGSAMDVSLAPSHPRRQRVMLMQSPEQGGPGGQITRMLLSMPFPDNGEIHVGPDLSEALATFIDAPAVPAAGAGGAYSTGASFNGGGASFAGASTGSVLGALAVANSSSGASGGLASSGSLDFTSLHTSATGQAREAYLTLQQSDVAGQVDGSSSIAGLPALLQRALLSSGEWTAGPGAPMPSALRDFAMSGPFELPELVAGDAGASQAALAAQSPTMRDAGPGLNEIVIPMPLWAQMGQRKLSATDQIMASPRAGMDFQPPMGMYRLVEEPQVDYTNGAPSGTPGMIKLVGPTNMQLAGARDGSVQASPRGGEFVLGTIPIDDGETAVTPRGRIRIGAPVDPSTVSSRGSAGTSLASSGASQGGGGSTLASSGSSFQGNAGSTLSGAGSDAGSLPTAPSGALAAPQSAPMRFPQLPNQSLPDPSGLATSAVSPRTGTFLNGSFTPYAPPTQAPAQPMTGSLSGAIRLSNDVTSRMLPSSGPAASVPGDLTNASSRISNAASNVRSSAAAADASSSAAGAASSADVAGSSGSFGNISLSAGAPSGDVVGGSSAANSSSAAALSPQVSRDAAAATSSASDAASSNASSVPAIAGLRPGLWSDDDETSSGYQTWTYAAGRGPGERQGGVDVAGLERPVYPSLPSSLRFRYVSAPLWWSSSRPYSDDGVPERMEFDRGADESDARESVSSRVRLASGLRSANSAAAIWRSIFVGGSGDDTGGMDRNHEAAAGQMSSVSRTQESGSNVGSAAVAGGMSGAALGGAGAMAFTSGPSAGAPQGMLAEGRSASAPSAGGPETVYIAMDKSGRAGTTTARESRLSPVEMNIVAAIPSAPPPVESLTTGGGVGEAARPHAKGRKAQAHGHKDDAVSQSKIEGSVDAVAQRIYHRIRRRIANDRERFGG